MKSNGKLMMKRSSLVVFKKKEIVLLRVIENTKTGKDLVETNS